MLDINANPHPAGGYARPKDILKDYDLTYGQKWRILTSWASDAYVVTSNPSMRRVPGSLHAVALVEIQDALRALDRAPEASTVVWARRHAKRHATDLVDGPVDAKTGKPTLAN